MVRIGDELVLRQSRKIHSIVNQVDHLIDSLHAIEELFDLKDGFDLTTQLGDAKGELVKATQLNTSEDRITVIQESINILIHVNENIEFVLMAFGVSQRSCLQKTLIVFY